MSEPVVALVLDVGGTRTRIALATRRDGRVSLDAVDVIATPPDELAPAIRDYLQRQRAQPASVGAAVAGPVDGEGADARAQLTNQPLRITASELGQAAGGVPALLLNDLGAAVACLPALAADEGLPIGDAPSPAPRGTRVLIGVGTGIGLAALLADGHVVSGEGGHVEAPMRDAIAERLRADGAHSIEDMLAGSQLARVYRAAGGTQDQARAEDVVRLCREGDAAARAALRWHAASLGRYARDCTLSFGAWGGCWLMGGALDGMAETLDAEGFRAAFIHHRVFGKRLRAVPTQRVAHPYPGLLGLAEQLLR